MYCKTIEEFDVRYELLKLSWGTYVALKEFAGYFEKFKAMNLKYHIIKGVVEKSGIVDVLGDGELYTTNAKECVNNVIKMWSPKKLDPYNFCIEYGKLLTEQESNILRCCLWEESTCELRPEFESIDFTQWTKLSPSKKINVRRELNKFHSR